MPKECIDAFSRVKRESRFVGERLGLSLEEINEFNLESKAMSFILHANVFTLYGYCVRKLSEPYEYELQEICRRIKTLLEEGFDCIKAYNKGGGVV